MDTIYIKLLNNLRDCKKFDTDPDNITSQFDVDIFQRHTEDRLRSISSNQSFQTTSKLHY
jgi:hypothetical protein